MRELQITRKGLIKILVVDDEPKVCEQVKLFFQSKGYEATTATNGEEAIAKLKYERPHLVLLDVRMPGVNGIEVLRQAKKLDPAVGVIMVTAVQDEEVFKEALEEGAFDYLTKPLNLTYLESRVSVKVMELLEH